MQRVTLIHHPTIALKISGFSGVFEQFAASGIYLGNIYRRIMPPSLPRVASVIEKYVDAEVEILDLRSAGTDREETVKTIDWEGYDVGIRRVGGTFSLADEAISRSHWIGLSSHFTFESGVIRDLIRHAKRVNPSVKVMVGGADVRARPQSYLSFGADYVCTGDFDPQAMINFREPTLTPPHRHPFIDLTKPAFHKLPHFESYTDSHDGAVPKNVAPPIAFLYFTRGCPRECDFCESRRTKFEALDLEAAIGMIEHHHRAGVRTLNFADDNLLLAAATKPGREHLLEIFRVLRSKGFAWEFPNGLEVGRFLREDGVDDELLDALLSHKVDPESGRIVGAYRVYVPLETFDRRHRYKKLKPMEDQNRVLKWLAESGLPEVDFGVVIPPDADLDTFVNIKEGYSALKDLMESCGNIRARYAAFHLIPIALFREMQTRYSVEDFPEGWNFYFPVYDGVHLTARQLFERRLELVRQIDAANYESMQRGSYSYA